MFKKILLTASITILIYGVGLFVINSRLVLNLGREIQRYNDPDFSYLIVVFVFVVTSYLFGYLTSKKATM